MNSAKAGLLPWRFGMRQAFSFCPFKVYGFLQIFWFRRTRIGLHICFFQVRLDIAFIVAGAFITAFSDLLDFVTGTLHFTGATALLLLAINVALGLLLEARL